MALSAETLGARLLSPKWSIAIDGVDEEQRQVILDGMKEFHFAPRDTLLDQGEPSDTLLLITNGRRRRRSPQ
ncbi:hypothetical protein ML401_23275 [Bradyrhizobium sp. 62B]|uniref:hypothetical protein n=1 Tax=Bradyrhizobium sp. 62B TaxID=2898442 RepID=UPI002557FE43|nr:hypothetical protein ML401_23275 [Bradyrhizobium sp. 62B]